jgi:hypothetical protein
MSNLQVALFADASDVIDPVIRFPLKKWVSETGIQVIDPAPWLNKHHIGKEIHFQSGYSSHWFKIAFPSAGSVHNGYDFLCSIALNFQTIGTAKISHVELYDGPNLLWNNYNGGPQGCFAFSMGHINCWNFNPALNISQELFLVFSVVFGAPHQYVPEFIFSGARAQVCCNEAFLPYQTELI